MFLNDQERAETLWACRFCMMCHVADRVAAVVRRESYTPRGRGAILAAEDKGFLNWDETISDIMYTTLNDGLLKAWCVGNYDHEELVLDARAKLFQQGLAPEEVAKFVKDLLANPNRGESPHDILAKSGVQTEKNADLLLFAGCSVRRSRPSALVAMGKLLNHAGIAFQVLGEEPCSGWALYQLGDLEGAKDFSVNLAEKIKASKASSVAVLDANAYRMLLTRTARFGGDMKGIRVVHVTSLLADWIDEGRIRIINPLSEAVTYHDPCVLARYCEDLESPRKILGTILENGLKEMATSGKWANCCGAGGMLFVHRPDVAREVSLLRLKEASETGASILTSACPRCVSMFDQAIKTNGRKGLLVIGLAELVASAAGV